MDSTRSVARSRNSGLRSTARIIALPVGCPGIHQIRCVASARMEAAKVHSEPVPNTNSHGSCCAQVALSLTTNSDDPLDHDGEAVLAALQSLPPRQRIAIALRYLDDHSVAEVATAMEIEYRAAESLIARGRRSLITAWEDR